MDADPQQMAAMMAAQGGKAGGAPSQEDIEAQEEAKRNAEEQRRTMLAACMTNEARERLSRIAIVKPEKARGIENMILAAAQRGALGAKVTEERLVELLEQINEREGASKPKITIQRRRPNLFEDD
ncbi:hypothetical protein CHLRE_12g557800v5 [Chlamydomonas reinhardtii]|uniref:Programmed cell death protein 5 n=1 Tax=Chlamydomonas reinhardtii TaxID=3055 RepID=A8JGY0_CHLRE|nr:uncharacterized protein CHLRE_12g557800v5 [Chlamydomonas reinhardtii]PNW75854.1 hypothetical protein CHLRE_12g557800v5 [Chlamydomonas reinhardtii]|eukprot:XP_001702825.1 predicted protein [Chlamydomonas reinhardtii]